MIWKTLTILTLIMSEISEGKEMSWDKTSIIVQQRIRQFRSTTSFESTTRENQCFYALPMEIRRQSHWDAAVKKKATWVFTSVFTITSMIKNFFYENNPRKKFYSIEYERKFRRISFCIKTKIFFFFFTFHYMLKHHRDFLSDMAI